MHTIKTTNGVRLLISNLVFAPETFKTISEVMTAVQVAETLGDISIPDAKIDEATGKPVGGPTPEWQNTDAPDLSLTEKQRELLKSAAEKHASRIPPTKSAFLLLKQLGFEP